MRELGYYVVGIFIWLRRGANKNDDAGEIRGVVGLFQIG